LYISIRFEFFDKLPSIKELQQIENNIASEVYTEDGQLLGKYYIQNRVNASVEEISPNLLNALIATEDARFFNHNGIDFQAWLRVFFKSILLQDDAAGGGSTLSQQLAKNLYGRKKYKALSLPINKIREMIIAKRLEKIYSKKELLTLYLNTVSFSDNVFGVKVASKRFFNSNPKNIKLEEAAVLVGMLKSTTIYNPLRHPEKAQIRRNTVLAQMEKYGYLQKNAMDSMQTRPIKLNYAKEGNTEGSGTYFREHLRLELKELLKNYKKEDGTAYNIHTDGLKIYTTIDSRMQRYAEEAVQEHMSQLQTQFFKHWKRPFSKEMRKEIEKIILKTDLYKQLKKQKKSQTVIDSLFRKPHKRTIFTWEGEQERTISKLDSIQYYFLMLNTGFLAMDPSNGHIKAWIGGINNKYFQYDHVKSRRQVGSTFKPLVYATALENDFQPCDYLHNELTVYPDYDNWQPENSDRQYGGVYSMKGALSKSINAVTVDLIMQTGIDSVKQLAQSMGISTAIPAVPSIALGAVDASLYDMVKVYGTLANKGVRPQPKYIRRIETKTGDVLFDLEETATELERVLEEATAQMMTAMLQSVVDSGTARRLRYQFHLTSDIAGKTGTTQNHSDGWFLGYTPNLVAGVWVGAESPKVHFRSLSLGQGANTALPIWGRFMNKVYNDPQFSQWKAATFDLIPDSLYWKLDCAPYLEEMPKHWDLEDLEEKPFNIFEIIFGKRDELEIEAALPTPINQNDKQPNHSKPKRKKKKLFERLFGEKNSN
jgi:penicillin-binding protein 1A